MWFNFLVYSFAENAFFFPNTMGSFCSLSLSCLLFHTSQHSRSLWSFFTFIFYHRTQGYHSVLLHQTPQFFTPSFHFLSLNSASFPTSGSLAFCFPTYPFFQRFSVSKNSNIFFCVAVFLESSVFSSRNIKSNCILQEKIYWCTFKKATITALIRKGTSNAHKRGIWGRLKVGWP